MTYFILPLIVYPFDILFCLGPTDQQFEKILSDFGLDPSTIDTRMGSKRGHCSMFYGNRTVIRTAVVPKTPTDLATLQHEIFHAVTFIMDAVGMKLSDDSDEAYAYLIGYITEMVYTKLKIKK